MQSYLRAVATYGSAGVGPHKEQDDCERNIRDEAAATAVASAYLDIEPTEEATKADEGAD